MKWEITGPDGREAYVSEIDGDLKTLLGDVIEIWSRGRNLHDWSDSDRMASICFYHTDLSSDEITVMWGTDGYGEFPGHPPWTLRHPDEGTLVIEHP